MLVAQSTLALGLLSSLLTLPSSASASSHGAPAHRHYARQETAATSTAAHESASATGRATATREAAASSTVTEIATTKSTSNKAAAASALPLTQYTYAIEDVPYQVNPYKSERGPQSGYNICNDTTKGDDSQCQTLVANTLADFCVWGSALTDGLDTVGDIEAAMVSYCTKDTHGARLIKSGALTGVQMVKTKHYTQWTGYIDQTALHLEKDDSGGELDPHGADLLGNPLGGLVYSTNLPDGDNKTYVQAIEWNNFIGSGTFCLKLCSPNQPAGTNYCENRYDRMGCKYNMPSAAKDGEFTECDSDLQDIVGVYTEDGKVSTYSQPPEGTAPNPPYEPKTPSSSNCKTYASTELYGGSATSTASGSGKTSAAAAQKTGDSSSSSSDTSSKSADSGDNGASLLVASTGIIALLVGAVAVL
ncbi:hypothetical protein JCM6882_000676 [Rhodosporidiobolus microsporus]